MDVQILWRSGGDIEKKNIWEWLRREHMHNDKCTNQEKKEFKLYANIYIYIILL